MAKRASSDFRRYAVAGAEQRLAQIADEVAQIYKTFPELRGRGLSVGHRYQRTRPTGAAPQSTKRLSRRRTMSPEGRKRISDAQKARWAKQKAQPAAAAPTAKTARKKR